MLIVNESFFNTLFEFVYTFVPSVNKLLNAQCKEWCWLQSKSQTNDWSHLGIWCKCLPT